MPTTTRSAHGLTKLNTAFDAVSSNGAAALDGVTSKGFTIFAPVDDAWTGEASTQANDSKVAPTMLGNHVSGEDCATVVLWRCCGHLWPWPWPR
jgi:hypothetical protein